ncbi:sugar phosphate isomerase/epimerase family protein [Plantactinospora sonchi]|uniref:Sugar phosphate isomerase/epimerase family protein n=1 Tax=Plantactinospora sonchi TaxID=1544735 RepID=A0ABU7RUR1_9ACTN
MKLVLHSYTFRRYPLRHVFAVARRYGWDGIELVHFHFDPARVEDEVADAVALGRRYGVGVHCVGYTGDFVSDDPQARAASLALAERTITAAARHGVGLVNGWSGTLERDPDDWRRNGSAVAEERHYARAAEGYRRLGAYAGRHGVRVGVEVYPGSVHDTVATTARLLAMVDHPDVVATADPGNAYVVSEPDRDPAVLDQLAGRLGYFHLKNLYPDGGRADFNVDTAEGVLDNYAWITRAASLGVPAICVEYCGDGDPHPPISRAVGYVRGCLALRDDLDRRHAAAEAAPVTEALPAGQPLPVAEALPVTGALPVAGALPVVAAGSGTGR